jgi:hypothetical protein
LQRQSLQCGLFFTRKANPKLCISLRFNHVLLRCAALDNVKHDAYRTRYVIYKQYA